MDAKRILQKVNSRENKERITVSISKEVLEELKRICGGRPLSPVIEEMMRAFNVDATKKSEEAPKKK